MPTNNVAQKPSSSDTTEAAIRRLQYLVLYNLSSTVLWFAVLARTLLVVSVGGYREVYSGVGEFTKWTQSLAVLEIVHSAAGIIKSPLFTTILQVVSRLLVVWLIVDPFVDATTSSPFYTSMLLAWSLTEVVRYGYFTQTLRGSDPGPLTWARYNAFFVLYPIGIASEVLTMLNATEDMDSIAKYAVWGVLAAYVPGSYVLYTHMMKQRRKQVRGKAPERRKRVDTL